MLSTNQNAKCAGKNVVRVISVAYYFYGTDTPSRPHKKNNDVEIV